MCSSFRVDRRRQLYRKGIERTGRRRNREGTSPVALHPAAGRPVGCGSVDLLRPGILARVPHHLCTDRGPSGGYLGLSAQTSWGTPSGDPITSAQTWVRQGGTLASLHRPLGYPIGGPHHFCTDLPGQGDTFGLDPITSAQTPGHPMRLPWLLCTDLGVLIKGSRKQELGQPFVRRRGAEKFHTDSHGFFKSFRGK